MSFCLRMCASNFLLSSSHSTHSLSSLASLPSRFAFYFIICSFTLLHNSDFCSRCSEKKRRNFNAHVNTQLNTSQLRVTPVDFLCFVTEIFLLSMNEKEISAVIVNKARILLKIEIMNWSFTFLQLKFSIIARKYAEARWKRLKVMKNQTHFTFIVLCRTGKKSFPRNRLH